MNKDNKKIEWLYELVRKPNFLNESYLDESFDWDEFFNTASILNMTNTLIESIELIDAIEENSRLVEKYKIQTKSGKNFFLVLTYDGKKRNDVFILSGIRHNKESPENLQYFHNLKNTILDNNVLCYIRFEDEEGRTNKTGEAGYDALELFASLKAAVMESLNKNSDKNIFGLIILVAKNEEKSRLNLYLRLVKNKAPVYNKILVDKNSDQQYTYIIATK